MSGFASGGLTALGSLAMAGVNYALNESAANSASARSVKSGKEMSNHLQALNRQNQLLGPSNIASGIKAAGVNPALMGANSWQSSPATGSAGPAPQAQANFDNPLAVANNTIAQKSTIDLQRSTTELQDSQANLNNEKAQEQALKNSVEEQKQAEEDFQIRAQLRTMLSSDDLSKDDKKRIYKTLYNDDGSDTSSLLNSGYLAGLKSGVRGVERALYDADTEALKANLQHMVSSAQVEDKKVIQALIGTPLEQFKVLQAKAAETWQNIKNLKASEHLTEQDVLKVTAQIEQLGAETQRIVHSDAIAMYDKGELGKYTLGTLATASAEKAPEILANFLTKGKAGKAKPQEKQGYVKESYKVYDLDNKGNRTGEHHYERMNPAFPK